MSRWPAAWLRMCSSSPICRPCAASPSTSTGPVRSSSPASTGPARSRRKRWRSTASSSPTPSQNVRPGPSLSVENARAPLASSSTTHTAIDGEHTPVIGPTWPCSLPLSSAHLAAGEQRRGAVAVGGPALEQARGDAARAAAGRTTRSHAIGGPECRSTPSSRPATTSPARATVTARGRTRLERARAPRAFAASTRSPWRPQSASSSATASASPPAGGRQSTSTASAPWSRTAPARSRQPDVHRGHPLEHAAAHRLNPPRRGPTSPTSPRSSAPRPACAPSATSTCSPACPAPALDGDDAAAIAARRRPPALCGEAIAPALLAADPYAAGAAAVATNVSDIRAMGGRPLALVDTLVSPDRAHAGRVLDGLAWAAGLLGVPVAGGHLTIGGAPGAVGVLHGHARALLRAARRAPRRRAARRVLPRGPVPRPRAAALHVAARPRARAAPRRRRGARRGRRARALPRRPRRLDARRRRLAAAAARAHRRLRRDARPRRASRARPTSPLEHWLVTFPSFGFVLAAAPAARGAAAAARSRAAACAARPAARSTTPASCGSPPAARRPTSGTSPPSRSPVRGAERDRHRLVRAGRGSRRPRRRAPSPARGRSGRSGAGSSRPSASPPSSPAVRTAKRTSEPPSEPVAERRQHREPVALPEPAVAGERIQADGPADHAAVGADRVQRRRSSSSRRRGRRRAEHPLLGAEHGAADRVVQARARPRRRPARQRDRAAPQRPASSRPPRRSSLAKSRSHADRPEHAWQRAQPAAASRWSSPCSESIADTDRYTAAT